MYFENIGFRYLGPVDGHNIENLENILEASKNLKGPILIHVITKKGKGYSIAEENPNKYHSISPFNIDTGEKIGKSKKDYSKVMGEKLVKLAKKNKKIVAVTAAMEDGTGLNNFAEEFPDRFFNVEIAEQHALAMVSGMAKEGLKPVIPIYSSFLQRGYDQVIHDICIQNLPVVICVDRAGIVGNDGETHQGMLDLSFLNNIPNLNIAAPKDFEELENMLEFAVNLKEPIAIRYPRGGETKEGLFENHEKIKLGKAEIIQKGENITVIAIGKMVSYAKLAIDKLEIEGIELINARFLKSIDKKTILNSVSKTKKVITIEDGTLKGGLASTVLDLIKDLDEKIQIKTLGYPDKFIKHGLPSEIEEIYHMDVNSIKEEIESMMEIKNEN